MNLMLVPASFLNHFQIFFYFLYPQAFLHWPLWHYLACGLSSYPYSFFVKSVNPSVTDWVLPFIRAFAPCNRVVPFHAWSTRLGFQTITRACGRNRASDDTGNLWWWEYYNNNIIINIMNIIIIYNIHDDAGGFFGRFGAFPTQEKKLAQTSSAKPTIAHIHASFFCALKQIFFVFSSIINSIFSQLVSLRFFLGFEVYNLFCKKTLSTYKPHALYTSFLCTRPRPPPPNRTLASFPLV